MRGINLNEGMVKTYAAVVVSSVVGLCLLMVTYSGMFSRLAFTMSSELVESETVT